MVHSSSRTESEQVFTGGCWATDVISKLNGGTQSLCSFKRGFLVATSLCSVELRGVSLNVRMYSKTGDHQQEDSIF